MFTHAIVRPPCSAMVFGLTGARLGPPDPALALAQHACYVAALESCGLAVEVLPPDEDFPDSTFVEDTALVTPSLAIVTRPGAPSRRGETAAVEAALTRRFARVEKVTEPGTVDAGDILMVGKHFYIGLSNRTNAAGAEQVIGFLRQAGFTGSTAPMREVLHLKTGVAWLEGGHLVAAGEFLQSPTFAGFNQVAVDPEESYAANCLWVNGRVLFPAGFPRLRARLAALDYEILDLDVSEFRKLDGGLSCLSLRY